MSMPNFLIIGAMKAGTTSLYHYLGQHPQIYMSPVKEPQFFAFADEELDFHGPGDWRIKEQVVTDIESYRKLFQSASRETAVGEASTVYLYSSRACERIHSSLPDAKLIAILRDPVERAHSNFVQALFSYREPYDDFLRAFLEEDERIQKKWLYFWHYKQLGFYASQLKLYFEKFDRRQLKIYLYDDWKSDNLTVLQDIYRFLNVDERFVPDLSLRYKDFRVPRSRKLHRFLLRPHPLKSALKPLFPENCRRRIIEAIVNRNLYKPQLNPHVRRHLIDVYREDIMELQDLIGRDLSAWLEV